MSDACRLAPAVSLFCLAAAGCGSAGGASTDSPGHTASAVATSASGPTIDFSASWTDSTTAPLVAGVAQTVVYDAARLPGCRGDLPGGVPGWSITAFYAIDGIPVGSFPVAGQGLSNTPDGPVFTPPFAGDLAMWFQITSAWGCSAYDSSFGQNYHFNVAAPANAPSWVGGTSVLIDRATCGMGASSGPCYGDAVSAATPFTYDTWARQDAAIREVYFDVWAPGVTDFVNPDLWKDLDVQVSYRPAGQTEFKTSYVNFSEYSGNNARYALQLASIDPLPSPPGNTLTDASMCPTVAATTSADGMYVAATVEYYFTVNGVAVTPSGGGTFSGVFQNYAGLFSICNF